MAVGNHLAIAALLADGALADPAIGHLPRGMRSQIRFAVCRCLRGAFRSASRIWSTNALAADKSSVVSLFFRGIGSALKAPKRCQD
jgi:hypothetical protein